MYADKSLRSQYKLCLDGLNHAHVRRVVQALEARMVQSHRVPAIDWGCTYGDINSNTSKGACIYLCWETPTTYSKARQNLVYWLGTSLDTERLKLVVVNAGGHELQHRGLETEDLKSFSTEDLEEIRDRFKVV